MPSGQPTSRAGWKPASVWVNQHPGMGPDIPFGGVKQSGIGVECGHRGMAEYTTSSVVNVKKT